MQGKNKRFTSVPLVNESAWRRRGIVAWALLGMAGVFVVVIMALGSVGQAVELLAIGGIVACSQYRQFDYSAGIQSWCFFCGGSISVAFHKCPEQYFHVRRALHEFLFGTGTRVLAC